MYLDVVKYKLSTATNEIFCISAKKTSGCCARLICQRVVLIIMFANELHYTPKHHWERAGKFEFEFGIEIKSGLNLNWIGRFLKYFLKKMYSIFEQIIVNLIMNFSRNQPTVIRMTENE